MAPFDTCIVVIVKWRGYISVVDRVTKGLEMKDHVPKVDSKARSHVCSANFGLTRAKGGTFLTFRLPCDGTTGAENNGATHTAKFEQGQLYTFANGVTNLGAPTGIAVCCKPVMMFWPWR